MQVVHPVCCGLDVHQATLTACVRRVSADGQITTDLREFGTTYPALLARSDWLVAQHCPVVAMESTGVYWKPVYHVLVGVVEVLVGNAREIPPPPSNSRNSTDVILPCPSSSLSCWSGRLSRSMSRCACSSSSCFRVHPTL